jgi:Ala-tRNA(Pro) deacylase
VTIGIPNVTVIHGDGTLGLPEQAPFDAIIVTAGAPEVPKPLIDQLAEGGRLVAPIGETYDQTLLRIIKIAGRLHKKDLGPCIFVPLIGGPEWNDRSFRILKRRSMMRVLDKLKEMLDTEKISYKVYDHPQAFTAQGVAALQHVPGRKMAKVVILKIDGSYIMAVLPASRLVDFDAVESELGAKEVSLATEEELASLFPECEIGAMPPFGNLFGLSVYVDPLLETNDEIYFNAGTHRETMRIRYEDFKNLAKPRVVSLTGEEKKIAA